MKTMIISLLLCYSCYLLSGQPAYIIVEGIEVAGLKRTNEAVVLRELPTVVGDTVSLVELPDELAKGEQQLMNTGLFSRVNISYASWSGATGRVRLRVEVLENWYLYPIPIFELADRNFNVWWVEQNRSLQRLNIGMEFTHLNFTGWRDRFRLTAKYGYERSYGIAYELPYLNRRQTLGLATEIYYARNRELNYATLNNKQEFYRDEDRFLFQRLRVETGLSWRPRIYDTHIVSLSYKQNQVDSLVAAELNPDFFGDGRRSQRYFTLGYAFSTDHRDVRPYPWKGHYFGLTLDKEGLGIFSDRNALTLRTRYEKYLPLGKVWSLGLVTRAKLSLIRQPQPYNDNRALGFGGYNLRGFEYYVVDGLDMGLLRSSLRLRIFDQLLNFGRLMPLDAFKRMPIKVFISLNNDTGYINEPFNDHHSPLSNRWLWGGGIGLDLLMYYDKVMRFEYSVNDLGETGFFLHFDFGL